MPLRIDDHKGRMRHEERPDRPRFASSMKGTKTHGAFRQSTTSQDAEHAGA
jgi:hypothetical protein